MERTLRSIVGATKGRFGRVLRIAVSIALLGWLVSRIGLAEVSRIAAQADSGWLLLAVLALVPAIGLRALTLRVIANKDADVLTMPQSTGVTLVGMSSALFLPPGVADLARAHIAYRALGRPEQIVSASLLERMASLLGLLVLGAIASLMAEEPLLAAASTLFAAIVFALVAFPRLFPWRFMVRFLSAGADLDLMRLVAATRIRFTTLEVALVTTALGWAASAAITYCVCVALGVELPFAIVALATILTAVSRLIPISAAGIGVGELTLSYVLIRAGVSADTAAGVALLTLVIGLILPGIVGMFVPLSSSPKDAATSGGPSRERLTSWQRLEPVPVRIDRRDIDSAREVSE